KTCKSTLLAPLDRELVLDFEERCRRALRNEAVALADEMDRHLTSRQIPTDERTRLRGDQRQRPVRQHIAPRLLQVTFDRIALFLEVARRLGEEYADGRRGGGRRQIRGLQ